MRKSELIDAIIAAEENESTVGYTDNEATVNTVTERTVNNSETANTNTPILFFETLYHIYPPFLLYWVKKLIFISVKNKIHG